MDSFEFCRSKLFIYGSNVDLNFEIKTIAAATRHKEKKEEKCE